MKKIKLFELFAGYGGASFALKKAGIEFETIGFSEIDPKAIQCYEQNHCYVDKGFKSKMSEVDSKLDELKKPKNFGDCSKINTDELPDFDLLTGGFPCQDVSIAGNRDLSKGRTKLFDEIIRIAEVKKPKHMLLENVKGLLSMQGFWQYVKSELARIGYSVRYKVLNSKDHGVPQNRERVWIMCNRDGFEPFRELFPHSEKLKINVKDILEEDVDKKYYLSEKQINRLKETHFNPEIAHTLTGGGNSGGNHSDMDGFNIMDIQHKNVRKYKKVSPTLCARMGTGGNNVPLIEKKTVVHTLQPRSGDPIKGGTDHLSRDDGVSYCVDTGNSQAVEIFASRGIGKENKQQAEFRGDGCSNSLTSVEKDNYVDYKGRWRRLTPRECMRLMGFLDDSIDISGLSDTAAYKLAGNGMDVNLLSKIFKTWLK